MNDKEEYLCLETSRVFLANQLSTNMIVGLLIKLTFNIMEYKVGSLQYRPRQWHHVYGEDVCNL